ncbi:MAG: hypothetical protein PUC75_05215 [Lachnospiraceae bacterium]|jgi:hypothetical protein|nr:hypothetical protein [Lachnospiraceae bacterium]
MEENWIELPHRIYRKDENGKVIAEISFPETKKGECTIKEVFFDEDYRSLEETNTMIARAVSVIHGRGEKVIFEHPYAKKWQKDHSDTSAH